MKKICILIPAYNPDERLVKLVNELKEKLPKTPVVIVDDGSLSENIFNILLQNCPSPDRPRLIKHSFNLGKGEALKSGFKYILKHYHSCKGIVTADCDLQHSVNDIIKIGTYLDSHPDKIYLGSRNFNKTNIPIKSVIGNKFTSFLFKLIYHINLNDTQTGLRGIPLNSTGLFLDIKTSDFSFETLMLIIAKKHNIPISEIPINTIYIENNKNSNFKPVSDSFKICKTILGIVK